MIKDFTTFVNENYYIRTDADRDETKTQKIIYPVNEYEIGERVQVSVYAKDTEHAGKIGFIAKPKKLMEGKVYVEFKDGKSDYFATTDINRI